MEKKSNTVKKKKTKRLDAKENFWGYVFLSPVIIGFLVFTVFPVVMSFYYSLTNYDGIQPPKFVGFQNYAMLFSYRLFHYWNGSRWSIFSYSGSGTVKSENPRG